MKRLREQKGMALLLVLVIVALLSALLTEFSFSTLVDLRATETFRDRTQAYYLARGGVEAARMILQQDQNPAWDHPSEFWGDLPTVPVDDGDISLKIEDLSGRINLNHILDSYGNPVHGFYSFEVLCERVLLSSPAEAEDLAKSLSNWINPKQGLVTPDDNYYARQDPPYSRKGAPLDTVEELQQVRYFDEEKVQALKRFIRVDGDDAINVNTAPAEVLYAWQTSSSGGLTPPFDDQDIEALIDYRQQFAFTQLGDLAQARGIGSRWTTAWLSGSVGVKGTVFQATSNGRINDVTRQVEAIIDKSNVKIKRLKVE